MTTTLKRPRRVMLRGIGASPGVAFGRVHLIDRRRVQYATHHIEESDVDAELRRLGQGVHDAVAQLHAFRDRVIAEGGGEHTAILDAHLLMMQDPLLIEGAERHIRSDHQCAEWALRTAVKDIRQRFDALDDSYFRERRSDIDFVGQRVLEALATAEAPSLDDVPDDAVVVAHDLSPADALALTRRPLRGFLTEVGAVTSHTAILARALGVPSVVGCAGILAAAGRNDEIVLDGSLGEVVLHPSKMLQAKYRGIARQRRVQHEEVLAELGQPTVTRDGHVVRLLANVELADEVQHALGHGARGIGLFRTEFLYLHGESLPSEDEQFSVYREALDTLGDSPALFRTFDLGSDKLSRHISLPREENPALGLRACRLGLQREDLLRTQVRALLRATAYKRGALMLPMISGVAELRQVKALIYDEMERLAASGVEVWREVPIGIMVELPSAVWVADRLAAECDFFSVGTNDLMQYSLAIDRGNEHVAYLYRPLHLSNLRALAHVAAAAKAANIPLSLCGEMAAEPLCAAICIALGYDTLSMPPASIPRIAWMVRRLAKSDLDELLAQCLELAHVEEIEGHVRERMLALVPELARRG